MITTVFFDLDDTLFDHQYSRRCGFYALKSSYPALSSADVRDMENLHEQLIRANYEKVLAREISLKDAMTERICTVCNRFGYSPDPGEMPDIVRIYDTAYQQNRRVVPGSRELLSRLKESVQVGIITNGFKDLQEEKIASLGLSTFIDILIISEVAGYQKPDRRIFENALAVAGSDPARAVYIGDSWAVDIVPATACGMKAVWLSRYGQSCPDPSLARVITTYLGFDLRELSG
ncbi:MAG TPA: HAD family hydrolase [Methanoregulaceae archaeon]|nr:HAD family hydrolase [Methanoregulaceae archaeon]HPD75987.1 HAD family hydrolase [Methanoregulaceae archaeon]HRY74926.1 HAD family hydrolase [Methanoregulaceae archaeon]